MDSPRTFTGENVVEITCHNNPFLIDMIISRFIKLGARLAQEGEFTQRAFLHGKLDLVQAEAIKSLLDRKRKLLLKNHLLNSKEVSRTG